MGAGDMVSVYIRHLLVQLETPDDIRGRVSAVNAVFIGASNELGEFESGLTAAWFGTVPAWSSAACATLVVARRLVPAVPGTVAHGPLPRARIVTPVYTYSIVRPCARARPAQRGEGPRRGHEPGRPLRGAHVCEAEDDGWGSLDELPRRAETVLLADRPEAGDHPNQSPDVPFDQSINPYQGCEHGCIYCFARPTHAYWNLGPGLDFETRIFHKPGLARLLDRELAAPGYVCKPINLGANTDPYQPAEREQRTTRELLEVLLAHRHPVTIVTKGALILRDLDLLRGAGRACGSRRCTSASRRSTTS